MRTRSSLSKENSTTSLHPLPNFVTLSLTYILTFYRVTHSLTDDVVPLPGNRFWYRDVSVFANAKGSSRNLRFAIETFFHKVLGD